LPKPNCARATIILQGAAAEADHASAAVMDGEHDAVAEFVVLAFVPLAQQSRSLQQIRLVLAAAKLAQQTIPAGGSIADLVSLDDVRAQAALLQVGNGMRVLRELFAVPRAGGSQHFKQGSLGPRGRTGFTWDVEACLPGQLFHRIDELETFKIHHEADGRTVGSAAEAVIKLLLRADGKRRCFLAVERAAGLEFLAGAPQWHAPADQFDDIDAAKQLLDEGFGYQAAHVANPRDM